MLRLFFVCLLTAVFVPMAKASTIVTHLEKTPVRAKAGLSAKVVTTLPAGTEVTTKKTSGAFTEVAFKIEGKTQTGFIATSNLQSAQSSGSKVSNVGSGEMKKSGYSSADVAAAVKGANKFDANATGADPNAKTELPEGSEDQAAEQVNRLDQVQPADVSPTSDFVKTGKLSKPKAQKK
jgi:uncharacterized protein YgiM (DUF1202 family)